MHGLQAGLMRVTRSMIASAALVAVVAALATIYTSGGGASRESLIAEMLSNFILVLGMQVFIDKSHFDQILWNLTRNAVGHAHGSVRAVRIAAQPGPVPQHVVLEVIDDGDGVPAEAVTHLFEPFFTTRASGTGLGLYIARELADVNGARLDYVGQGVKPPGGACFRLTLPRNAPT